MANDFSSVFKSQSKKWLVLEEFEDRKLLRQTILINFYDKLSVVSHKKCSQHFHCADGGKLYIMSGQFALKKCSIVLTSVLRWMRTKVRTIKPILLCRSRGHRRMHWINSQA